LQQHPLSNCVSCLVPAGHSPNNNNSSSANNTLDTGNDAPTFASTPDITVLDTSANKAESDKPNKASYIEPSAEEREAGLRAIAAVHQPDLPSTIQLTPTPLVCLPDKPTPFLCHGLSLGYLGPSSLSIEATPTEVAGAAKSFKRVAQHEEPQSALQCTPQLCLKRLGGTNSHSHNTSHFQTTVKYQQETRAYGRSTWQTVEFSLRFDLHPEPSSASCKADNNLTKTTPLQKQLSDDLAPHKTDTQGEDYPVEASAVSGHSAGDLFSKAVLYASQFSGLLRRVSSRWSSSSD
jgi:hypothetical protein